MNSEFTLDINIAPYEGNLYSITLNGKYLAFVEIKEREADGKYITDNVYSIDDVLDNTEAEVIYNIRARIIGLTNVHYPVETFKKHLEKTLERELQGPKSMIEKYNV